MDRYSSKTGSEVDLYLYIRNSDGLMVSAYSVGQVYVYRNDPIIPSANTVVASLYGSVTVSNYSNRMYDSSIDFNVMDISVGNYLEIDSGNNIGYYKILSVGKHYVEIDGSFSVTESGISYKVTLLKSIETPIKVGTGVYKIHLYIPKDYDGGYYYDYWKDIKLSPASAGFDKIQTFYVANDIPYFVSSKEEMTDRYMAYQGGIAFLDMEFRSRPNYMPFDPYSIEDVRVYRKDPSDPAHPIAASVTSIDGAIDASDHYLFTDAVVDFKASLDLVKRYDTLVVTAPVSVEGRYVVSEVVDNHNLKIMTPFSVVTSNITYTIEPFYFLDVDAIVKQNTGEYAIPFAVPTDFQEDHYWDEWRYMPGVDVLDTNIAMEYDVPGNYTLSNPANIAIAGSRLSLVTPLASGKLERRPYAYNTVPFTLNNPESMSAIVSEIVPGNKSSVEYSLIYNGTDLWFDGDGWIPNTGSIVKGDEEWDQVVSVWHMSGDWKDGKRSNNGIRFGTGVEFGVSSYLDGVAGLFNGTNDYVSVPYSNLFDIGYDGFMVVVIFNTSANTEQVLAMHAFSADAASGGPGWVLKMQATGELNFMIGTGTEGTAMNESVSSLQYNDGNDHLAIILVNNDASDNFAELYVDDNYGGFFPAGGLKHEAFGGFVYDVVFGADYDQGLFDRMFYNGTLKEVAIIKIKEGEYGNTRLKLVNNIMQNRHSMVPEKIENALTYLNVNDGDVVAPVVYLVEARDRFGIAPIEIEKTLLNWKYYNTEPISRAVGDVYVRDNVYDIQPGPVNTCTVVGRIIGLNGDPVANAKVTAYGYEKPWDSGGNITVPQSIETETDNGGYFYFRVVQGIKVWLSIPWLNYRKKVTIPNVTRINWLDLKAEEEL